MNRDDLLKLLEKVAAGGATPGEALERLKGWPVEELGYANLDTHRPLRTGMVEAIYAAGKTPEQVCGLLLRSQERHGAALATRVTAEVAAQILPQLQGFSYSQAGRVLWRKDTPGDGLGLVAVVCAGTSDLPVVEEAALTLEFLGSRVERVTDVGVAGLHRLVRSLDTLRRANVLIVVAGMEGALPSVVGGLVDRPVIAVPTSVGYGTHLGGLTPLLAMLNSCAPGISVVNIDNGYGAACTAHLINRLVAGAGEAHAEAHSKAHTNAPMNAHGVAGDAE
jgi:NCAIR mutase (PurE)-related protein